MACDARCCETFFLPFSPDQVETELKGELSGERLQIFKMLIPLPADTAGSNGATGDDKSWPYTCKNLTDDKRCAIYKDRPDMCRDYPYHRECGHCGWRLPEGANDWSAGRPMAGDTDATI
ncbi:MAG: YkgJ family cysteine cluster protein [Planctomycetes bacterium]|nr:YkgJ family cysteine cluster protein [Planctomycetota bacterium]